jgi:hypothetical protein
LSALSEAFVVLCAYVPDAPLTPTTTASGNNVIISWPLPYNGGSVVTGYYVYLLSSNGSFIQESTYCFNSTTLLTTRTCTLPIAILTLTPFSLNLGDSITVRIVAVN